MSDSLQTLLYTVFFLFFTLPGFCQQVSLLKQGTLGDAHAFQRDDAGNFYAVLPLYSGTTFYGTTVIPPVSGKKYRILGKFDSNMSLIWVKPFRWDYTTWTISTRDNMAIDKTGNIYLADEDTTYKFSGNGKLIWKKGFTGYTIKLNKQGQPEFYRFKNATNTLNGNPILNNDGTVVTMDTAGNYLRHFTLHNSAYQGQTIWGRNYSGYYGVRTGRHNVRGIYPQEIFICDSLGNTLQSNVLSYTTYNTTGNIKEFIFDPIYQRYYLAGIFRNLTPINKPDSITNVALRADLVQLNANLQLSKILNLGPAINTGGILYEFPLKTHRGNLFFSAKVISWTPSDKLFTHLGILNYLNPANGKIIIGKIDRNLNPVWAIEHGNNAYLSNFMQYPIPTDEGIFYNGNTDSFSNKYINFTTAYTNVRDSFIMKITDTDSTSAELSGKTFADLNQNGIDDNEPGVLGQTIWNNTTSALNYTDEFGSYNISAVTGPNTIHSGSLPQYWTRSTPDSSIINVPASIAQLTGPSFGMYPIPGIKDAAVNLTAITPIRINMPISYQLSYRNNGTDVLNGTVKMVKAPDLNFLTASVTPNIISGDTLIWQYINLPANDTRRIQLNFSLPNNPTLNDKYLFNQAVITPLAGDTVKANNSIEIYNQITGPRDPNDISVTPSCPITPSFITTGKYLEYRIRFQNLGTDTAYSVVIKDSLSTNLDLSSLEFTDQSHKAKVQLKDNILQIYFENIKLPHSAINYVSSNGFFSYRIKVKPNTTIGTSIKNKAAIFFDYNVPINTNQVVTPVNSTKTAFTASTQSITCNGASNGKITINNACSTTPVRYSLDSTTYQPSPVFSHLQPGTYTVWIKDENGSYKLNVLQIQQPDTLKANITVQHANSGNGRIILIPSGGVPPYTFSLNGGTAQSQASFVNLIAGTYQVSVTDKNNCVKNYTVNIQNISGTKEKADTSLKIYPNPFTNTIQIETNKLPDTPVDIYNTLGQLVYIQKITTRQTSLDLKDLPAGVYFLKVNTAKGYSLHKILKK